MADRWSDREEDILREVWPTNTSKEISGEHLNRSHRAIQDKAYRMGIKTEEYSNDILPKPDDVEIVSGKEWENLAPATRFYHRNKEDVLPKKIKQSRERKEKIKEWVERVKAENGCCFCDEDIPECLVFHHVDSSKKRSEVGKLVGKGLSVDNIHHEMEKCVVLCSNCHRKFHAGIINSPKELSALSVKTEYSSIG